MPGRRQTSRLRGDRALLLRSYKPFVTRPRLADIQRIRRGLADQGLLLPVPIMIDGRSIFRSGTRWAEVEPYLPSTAEDRTPEQLFGAIGRLYRALVRLPPPTTRDLRPAFVELRTLRRWIRLNHADGLLDAESADDLDSLVRTLQRQWVAVDHVQPIHRDPHGENLRPAGDDTLYLDLGGVANAPRIQDLAVALAYLLRSGRDRTDVDSLIDAYSDGARSRVTAAERAALAGRAAAVAITYEVCGWGSGWRAIAVELTNAG